VARELELTVQRLRAELGLAEPYHDPNVAIFGLRNAVMALGDTFVEVVSPAQDGTAAGRHLERHGGDAGYMVMFQTDDLAGARRRAAALGHRVAWEIDLPDIGGTHLHPGDVPGAIVSIDQPTPPEAWAWAGPDWTGGAPPVTEGRGVTGVTLRSPRPSKLAEIWEGVLDAEARNGDGGDATIALDAGRLHFTSGEPEGIAAFEVRVAPELAARGDIEIAGVCFRRS
jgi:hypothetical protein